jgi:hypothetical protein
MTFEDYLDDARQPETAAQAKNFIDMIAGRRREARDDKRGPLVRPQRFKQHPYHRVALAFSYTYESQVSNKIDYFVYTHPVGHTLEFAESGIWQHKKARPNWRLET